jgi:hypothetical protein
VNPVLGTSGLFILDPKTSPLINIVRVMANPKKNPKVLRIIAESGLLPAIVIVTAFPPLADFIQESEARLDILNTKTRIRR